DDDIGVVDFVKITPEDITAQGKLVPVGARHFAAQAQLAQNLNGIFNSQIGMIIQPHVSSIQMAKLIEELFGLERFKLVQENIALQEQYAQQQVGQQMTNDLAVQSITPTDGAQ
ncbi:MAG: hypothetical protein ACWGQW_19085, partial [bacterium]